jgi:acetyl-CoA carboxylase carboxyltransferase component
MQNIEEKLVELLARKKKAMLGGGIEKLKQQHQKNKLTARERLDLLLDKDSFREQDIFLKNRCTDFDLDKMELACEGVVTGRGLINGRNVFVFSQDMTVMGGSAGEAHCAKICRLMDEALMLGVPIIGINDSVGARIQEGMGSMNGYAPVFYRNVQLSGVVPQISLILGPCAGGAVYSPALTDFVFVVRKVSLMFITGPDIIRVVTHEQIGKEELGGADIHSSVTGVSHFLAESEEECMKMVSKLLSFLPSNSRQKPPRIDLRDERNRTCEDLRNIIPENPAKGYDVRKLIRIVVDAGDFFEVQAQYAANICIGFGRMHGNTVGIVANQPSVMAGCLDINASVKAARFVRFCDAFNIPIITFADCPGYLPGVVQEHGAIIRHGSKLLFAFSEATVPKITVVVRKNYGGGYSAMSAQGLGADYLVALPTAEIAVMGAEGAVNMIYRDVIKNSVNPEEMRCKLIEDYREKFATPYKAAEFGLVNDVIDPSELRSYLIDLLEIFSTKEKSNPPKKHGNIPL